MVTVEEVTAPVPASVGQAVSDKALATELVARMPDDATLDDIADRIALTAALRAAEASLAAGRTMTQAEAVRRFQEWSSSR